MLIVSRTQCAKEVSTCLSWTRILCVLMQIWRRRLDLSMTELTNLRETNALRDTTTKQLIDDVKDFIRIHSNRIRRLTEAECKEQQEEKDVLSREPTTLTNESLIDKLEVSQVTTMFFQAVSPIL